MLECDKRDQAITCMFCRNSFNIDVFCSSTKRSLQRNVKFSGRFFQTN